MQRIYDMTEQEVLALTDEQVEKYIDYECALEGAPMLPPAPGIKPVVMTLPPDVQAFLVAGIITREAAHAARIMDAINSGIIYEAEYAGKSYKEQHIVPIGSDSYHMPHVEAKRYHSPEQWDTIKNAHTEIAAEAEQWEKVKKAYDEACNARSKITDNIWEYVGKLRDHAYDRDQLKKEFTRYLELAEDNKRIAFNFLKKAKDLSDFPELEAELCPPENTNESPA